MTWSFCYLVFLSLDKPRYLIVLIDVSASPPRSGGRNSQMPSSLKYKLAYSLLFKLLNSGWTYTIRSFTLRWEMTYLTAWIVAFSRKYARTSDNCVVLIVRANNAITRVYRQPLSLSMILLYRSHSGNVSSFQLMIIRLIFFARIGSVCAGAVSIEHEPHSSRRQRYKTFYSRFPK
jgi:hypothetical protein